MLFRRSNPLCLLFYDISFLFRVFWIFGMPNDFDVDISELRFLKPIAFPKTLEIFFECDQFFAVESCRKIPQVLMLFFHSKFDFHFCLFSVVFEKATTNVGVLILLGAMRLQHQCTEFFEEMIHLVLYII